MEIGLIIKPIFVAIITAHLQDHEQDSKIKIPYTENVETDFFQGTDLVDKKTNYQIDYSLNSNIFYKESGENSNKIYLENKMKEWIPAGEVATDIGFQTIGEWGNEIIFTEAYYNPLEMVTFSQYIDRNDIETGDVLENCIISNVPALFVKHAGDLREWQKVHQMVRIGTDVLMILGSIATIESGASGMILYAALADLGLATTDIGLQSIRGDLEKYTEGKKFLEKWDDFYNITTFFTVGPVLIKALEKKIPQIIEKSVPLYHSFKLQKLSYEKFSNILLKSVYSLSIKGFCKSGLQLIRYNKCATELGRLYKGAFRLQDAGLLFIKNIKGDVSTIYKGIVLKSGSKEDVGNFINRILKKSRNNRKKIVDELERLVGKAEDIDMGIRMSPEEFIAGKQALLDAKITAETAFDYLDDALIYFNHHIVNGKVVQISNRNCINVVDVVEHFLRTGEITVAAASGAQKRYVLTNKYGGVFLTVKLETIKNPLYLKKGERGILLCERGPDDYDHVLNVFMTDEGLMYKDCQSHSQKYVNEEYFKQQYVSYKILKTKKN